MKEQLFSSRYDFTHYYDKGVLHPIVFPSRVGRFLSWAAAQRAARLRYKTDDVELDQDYYTLLCEGYSE